MDDSDDDTQFPERRTSSAPPTMRRNLSLGSVDVDMVSDVVHGARVDHLEALERTTLPPSPVIREGGHVEDEVDWRDSESDVPDPVDVGTPRGTRAERRGNDTDDSDDEVENSRRRTLSAPPTSFREDTSWRQDPGCLIRCGESTVWCVRFFNV